MNKKIKTTLFVFIVIGVIVLNITYKNKNDVTKTNRKRQNNLAIMIKEDGTTDYTKSNSKDIPKGNYVLNRDKSYCKNNGAIGDYDSVLGKVSFSFIGTDSCFLYFDYEVPSVNILGVKIPLDTELDSSGTSSTKYIVSNENGYRYEGADPNNYICLDNKTSGTCSSNSLLFRIIGLFDEEYSSDGTTSAGTTKILKILDTNNFGGTSGKSWSRNDSNNWSKSTLNTELNETYLSTLLATSGVNSKLSSAIVNAKWHLGGANNTSSSNYYNDTITTENWYKAERSPYATSGTLQNLYSGNPEYVFAKVGLMYPSDYGYATVGGSTTNKSSCGKKGVYNWDNSSFSDCKNNDWIFTSQVTSWGSNMTEWLISPNVSFSNIASSLNLSSSVRVYYVSDFQLAVRPTFYLDSSILKIVGGLGTKDNAYRIG